MKLVYNILLSSSLLFLTSCGPSTDPQPLKAVFTVPTGTNFGSKVNYDNLSTGDPDLYEWTFEGAVPNASTERNPTVIYKSTGTYTVSLKVTKGGESDTMESTITVTCSGADCDDLSSTRDLNYGIHEQHMAHIFEPKSVSPDPLNMIILFGGGGGGGSNLDLMEPVGMALANQGYVVAIARYRNEANFLNFTITGPQDTKAAVRYFRSNASEWNIDPDKIFIGGNSSGAAISLIHSYTDYDEIDPGFHDLIDNLGGWEGEQGTPGVSSDVAGVISLAGVMYGSLDVIDAEDVPVFAVHGDGDLEAPCGESTTGGGSLKFGGCSIAEEAEENGLLNALVLLTGGDHDTPRSNPTAYMTELVTFLNEIINN